MKLQGYFGARPCWVLTTKISTLYFSGKAMRNQCTGH